MAETLVQDFNKANQGKAGVVVVLAKMGDDGQAYMIDDENGIPIAGKGNIEPYTLVNAVATSGDVTSAVVDTRGVDNIGLDISWTDTTNGALNAQWSMDGSTAWRNYDFDPVLTQPAGSADNAQAAIFQTPYPYLRVQFVRTDGTGAMTVKISAKAV